MAIADMVWSPEMATVLANLDMAQDAVDAAEAAAEADSIAEIVDNVEAIRSMVNRLIQRVAALEVVKAAADVAAVAPVAPVEPVEPTTATDYLALIGSRSNSSAPAVRQNLGGRADRPAAEAFRPLVDRLAAGSRALHTDVPVLRRLASPCRAEHAPHQAATWYSAIMYAASDGARSRLTAMMLALPREECQ